MSTKITENFSKEEFACKCGCGFMEINPAIVQRLQVIRDVVGLPIDIISGCRCKKHNEECGGEEKSQHLLGNAIDFTIEGYDMSHLAALITKWSGGFHFYPAKNFIHVDVGMKRRW